MTGWRTVRDGVGAVVGVVLGAAPHVLHHVGLLAGTALVTGAGGNALFYVVGLALTVPMLVRLHRRFGTAWAPALALAVFTGLFALSSYVVAPALTDSDEGPGPPAPTSPAPDHGHGH